MLQFLSIDNTKYTLSKSFYTKFLLKKLKDVFIAAWKNELFSDSRKKDHGNKLCTYRMFKSKFITEAYLIKCHNVIHRKTLARFRLSAHNLNIEKLRYIHPRIPPEDRICNHCTHNECEDEFHFIINCDKYIIIRDKLFKDILLLYPSFNDMDDRTKFKWLCSSIDENIIKLLGSFISTCFSTRNA